MIRIGLLECGQRNTNDLRNNMIILNNSTISCEEINKLLFTFNETNDILIGGMQICGTMIRKKQLYVQL